eukprot:CAMPEP_0197073084 /NCGR_PEP_ID=MMETSP1384-20130603/210423_1 /TAXON_ID=29189 /ORGANISM="Ammonia sp." /LENGTH=490 /DNA_ID=CAMNT_0042511909 /DNA_START=82 /DNA_END=1554 /DNA_ORIENTATION=+
MGNAPPTPRQSTLTLQDAKSHSSAPLNTELEPEYVSSPAHDDRETANIHNSRPQSIMKQRDEAKQTSHATHHAIDTNDNLKPSRSHTARTQRSRSFVREHSRHDHMKKIAVNCNCSKSDVMISEHTRRYHQQTAIHSAALSPLSPISPISPPRPRRMSHGQQPNQSAFIHTNMNHKRSSHAPAVGQLKRSQSHQTVDSVILHHRKPSHSHKEHKSHKSANRRRSNGAFSMQYMHISVADQKRQSQHNQHIGTVDEKRRHSQHAMQRSQSIPIDTSSTSSTPSASMSISHQNNLRPSLKKVQPSLPPRSRSHDTANEVLPKLAVIHSKDNGEQFDHDLQTKESKLRVPGRMNLVDSHSQNIWNVEFDGDCKDIEHCMAVQRIVFALKWYSDVSGNADEIWKRIQAKQYERRLLGDYCHVMNVHLSPADVEQMGIERAIICQQIANLMNACDARQCLGHQRRQKKREYADMHVPFYVQCMDTIHCYFMHNMT